MVSAYKVYILCRVFLALALIRLRNVLFRLIYKGTAPPRPGTSTVSQRWIQTVIRKNGFPGVVVESIVIGDNANNRGLVGSITKIQVIYAPEHRNNASLPTRLVLKMSKSGLEGAVFTIGFRSSREAFFFTTNDALSISPLSTSASLASSASDAKSSQKSTSVEIQGQYPNSLSKAYGENAPFMWYAYSSSLLGEVVLLQSDVSFNHQCTPLNYVFGNQIWGLPAPVEPPRDVVQTLTTVFTTTAKHHAKFWNNPALIKLDWMKGSLMYQGKDRAYWEYALVTTRSHWVSAQAKADKPGSGVKIDPKLRAILDKTFEMSNWEDFQTHIKSTSFTLCHGDFHAANMFLYRKEGSEADIPLWFDWSEVGPYEPTSDLAQMIISDIKPEVFIAHSKDLVRAYYDTLIKNGVSAQEYSWQTCWNGFCRGGVERWIWGFSHLADFPLPANCIQYFHDQLLAFINHHCPSADHFKLKLLAAAV